MPFARQLLINNHRVASAMVTSLRLSTLVIKFLLNLFIAKYLGFEELGIFGLIATTCIVFPIVISLGLSASLNRRAITQDIAKSVGELKNYFGYITLSYTLLFLFIAIWCYLSGNWLLATLIYLVVLLEHINNDFYSLLLNLSRPILANILHFFRAGFWPLIYIFIAYHDDRLKSINLILSFWAGSSAISLLLLFIFTSKWPWTKSKRDQNTYNWLKHELINSRFLYVNGLADTAGQHIERYIITLALGLELTGVYVFYTQIITAISNLLHTGVIQFSKPKLVRLFSEKHPDYFPTYKRCFRSTLAACSLMSISATIITYFALPLLKLDLAYEWFSLFPVLLIGLTLFTLTQVGDLIFYSQHKDSTTLKLSLTYFASKIAFSMALLPLWGLWGAGATAILSGVLKIAIQRVFFRRVLPAQR